MFKKAMIAGAVVLASMGANAASVNMTVTGTITPEACAITLGNSGNVDYGTLPALTVKSYGVFGSVYTVPAKTVPFDVTCGAPTAVAINWTDNRASSRVAVDSVGDPVRFGLGVSGTSNIGAYQMGLQNLQVKATTAGTLAAPAGVLSRAKNTTGTWSAAAGQAVTYFSPTLATGFKLATADTAPPAIAQISGNINMLSYFNKALVDSATGNITLDGSATVALEYL